MASGHIFTVPRRVLDEIFSDREWYKRFSEAVTFQEAMRVVKDFCQERGYGVHHDIVSGRLVVCR